MESRHERCLLLTLVLLVMYLPVKVVSSSYGNMLVGSELFLVRNEKLSWSSAQQACEKHGGYLAEPQNLTALRNYMIIQNLDGFDYWIGGSDQDIEGSWIWTRSGNPIDGDWIENQPDGRTAQNCLDFQPKHSPSLNDYTCRTYQKYICQMDQPSELKLSTVHPKTGIERACRDSSWFRCESGQDIRCRSRCDGQFDCRDQSDEEGCHEHIATSKSSTRTSRASNDVHPMDWSEGVVIGVIISGLILMVVIIGVATYIFRKAKIARQNNFNDHLESPLNNGRFEPRRPSELCHTGPAAFEHQTIYSNNPVPSTSGDNYYNHGSGPRSPSYRQEGNYDHPKSPLHIHSISEEGHYDCPKSPLLVYNHSEGNYDCPKSPVRVNSLSGEGNYDCPKSPVSLHSTQDHYSIPGSPLMVNEVETLYDSPKSNAAVDSEPTYDLPRRPSQGVFNPTNDTAGCMLYDSPRSQVTPNHVPSTHEEDLQMYDTPKANHTGLSKNQVFHSDILDPIYANQNEICKRQFTYELEGIIGKLNKK